MQKISRRTFVSKTAMGLGGACVLSQMPGLLRAEMLKNNIKMPIGFQSFAVRDMLEKDFPGTLKTMSAMGYQLIEMCSPKGYASIGFGRLEDMKPAEMKRIINDAGLSCPSCHFGFGELTDHLDERIEFARQLGLTQMICSTFWLPETSTLKDYQVAADKLNKAAEKIKKAGMQAGFHNHGMEFAKLEG
jgi:sugar phosphate isomerase/epimerase